MQPNYGLVDPNSYLLPISPQAQAPMPAPMPQALAPAMTARQKSFQTILSLTPDNQRQQLIDAYSKDPELSQVAQNYKGGYNPGFQDTQNLVEKGINYGADTVQQGVQAAQGAAPFMGNVAGALGGNPLAAFNAVHQVATNNLQQNRQLAADTGTTALNLAGLVPGAGLLGGVAEKAGAALLPRIGMGLAKGAVEGAGYGAAQGAISTIPNAQATPQDYLNNASQGALAGAAGGAILGGGAPLAGAAVRGAARGIGAGIDHVAQVYHPTPEVQAKTQALIDQGVPAGHAQMLAQGGQEGHYSISAPDVAKPFNPHLPAEVNQQIYPLQMEIEAVHNQIAEHRDSLAPAMERVDKDPLLNNAAKNRVKQTITNEVQATVNSAQQELPALHQKIMQLDPTGKSMPTVSYPDQGVQKGHLSETQALLKQEAMQKAASTPLSAKIAEGIGAGARKVVDNVKETLKDERGSIDLGAKFGKDEPKPQSEVIADALGLKPEERVPTAKAKSSIEDRALAKQPDGQAIMDGTSGKTPEQLAQDKARMEAMQKPTKNQVDLTPGEGGVKSAIANSQMVRQELSHRADVAFAAGRALSKEDRQLASHYEYGQSIADVASQAKNPEKMAKALTKLEDYYDYKLAAERAAGAQVPKVDNYARHFWDLSKPEDQSRFNELATQQGIGKFQGTSSQPRVFRTYAEGEAAGFKRQNSDIFKDLAQDANSSGSRIEGAALKEGVLRAGGKEVSTKGNGVDENGKQFVNSNIDGLNGLSYSQKIADQLKGYQTLDRNVFGKTYDKLNSFQKNVVLSLSLFHSMNISLNFAGAEAFRHPFVTAKGFGQSALGFISPRYAEHVMNHFRENGTMEWAQRNGIALGSNHDINPEGLQSKVGTSRANLITQGHKAIFEREIPIMTLHMAELAKKSGVEAGSTEGIKLGQEINQVMGLMNQKIMSRNPNDQKWLNRLMLAPAFTETKYRTLFDAATKWKGDNAKAGNLARQAVGGKTVIEGLIGIAGGIIATGQFPTLQQVLSQAVDPYISTDIKNKAGGTKGAFLPHSFIGEVSDPLNRLAHGDTSGVIHYANARLSPNLSTASKLLTNQDYFGNPIFDPNKPTGPQIAGQALKQVSPIGVQNVSDLVSGKKGIAETALNEAGLRVKNDPSNPINQQTAAFFNTRTQLLNGMNKNQQADFNSINPATKNPDGSYTPEASWNAFKDPQKVYTLLKDPAVLGATIKLNQSQPNHDPMWDLPVKAPDGEPSLTTFLVHEGLQGTDYGSATAKTIVAGGPTQAPNPWINDVNAARSKFFSTLPPSQNPNSQNPLKYPAPSQSIQDLMTQAQGITDPKQKALFYQMHPELTDAQNQISQYDQGRRAQQLVPQFAQAPVASPQVQQMMSAGNFSNPMVQQFMNQEAAFKVSGPFGNGIQGAGGTHNTSQLAMDNLGQGLQANGKPSAFAQNSARNKAASMQRSLKNNMKYANKNERRVLRQDQQGHGAKLALVPHFKPQSAPKGKGLAAALKGLSRKA